jgi:putative chitinase
MIITLSILKKICPLTSESILQKFIDPLNRNMAKYGIDSALRVRHFIAQVAHESGCFNYTREIASGAAYDIGRLAVRLGNTAEADGDGQKYKGRGLIQITGRANYSKLSKALFGNESQLLKEPILLEQPEYAVESACWFWQDKNLNAFADKDNLLAVTKRINGGTNGIQHRIELYNLCKRCIS